MPTMRRRDEPEAPASWPEAMQVLAAHASACLSRSRRCARRRPCSRCGAAATRPGPGPRRSRRPRKTAARGATRDCSCRRSSCTTRRPCAPVARSATCSAAGAGDRARPPPLRRARVAVDRRARRLLPAGARAHARGRRFGAARRIGMIDGPMRHEAFARLGSRRALVVLPRSSGASARDAGQLAPTAHPPLSDDGQRHVARAGGNGGDDARRGAVPTARRRGSRARGRQLRQRADARQPPVARRSALADYARTTRASPAAARAAPPMPATRSRRCGKRKPDGLSRGCRGARRQPKRPTALGDHARALDIYEKLDRRQDRRQRADPRASRPKRRGCSAIARKTAEALLRVYYEFPLTDAAVAAAAELEPLRDIIVRQGYKLDLGRAVQLYGARRYSDARAAFAALQAEVERRRSRARRSPHRRVRLSSCSATRRRATACGRGSTRRAPGRSALLLPERAARARPRRRVPRADAGARPRLSRQLLVRGGAQQPRHLLHPQERRRAGGQGLRRAVREVPERPARRARGMEVGLVGLQERRLRRDGARLREGAAAAFPRSDYRPLFLYWSARSHGKLERRRRRRVAAAARRRPTTATRTTAASPERHPAAQRADGADRGRRAGRPASRPPSALPSRRTRPSSACCSRAGSTTMR